ncbi:MAG: hypothetical protein MSA28_01420 [Prevotella sp.]|nr:hypothetical protein [Prevotella sp.]
MEKILLFLALLLPLATFAQTKRTTTRSVKTGRTTSKVATPVKKINLDYQVFQVSFVENNKSLKLEGDSVNAGYVVFTAPGYSQKELYQKIILGLNNIYTDIDKTVTKIEYDAITINAYDMPEYGMFQARYWDLPQRLNRFKYRISIKIKDGKVRVDSPTVSSVWTSSFIGNDTSMTDFKEVAKYVDALDIINRMDIILKRILQESFGESQNSDW